MVQGFEEEPLNYFQQAFFFVFNSVILVLGTNNMW